MQDISSSDDGTRMLNNIVQVTFVVLKATILLRNMKAEFPKYNNVKHETLYTAKFYVVKGGSPQVDLHPYPRAGRAF